MKKTLIILGGLFAIVIVTGLFGFAYLAVEGSALDEDSKAYVDEVTPRILSSLNRDTLFQYASEELKNSASPEEFDKIFSWFGKLGKFIRYNGSNGQATISVTSQAGRQVTGAYSAQAEFESGPATVKVSVIQKGDAWKVMGFRINSMALAN